MHIEHRITHAEGVYDFELEGFTMRIRHGASGNALNVTHHVTTCHQRSLIHRFERNIEFHKAAADADLANGYYHLYVSPAVFRIR